MFRPCPDCGDPLSVHGSCGSCGYGARKVNGKAPDPDWHRCANTERGMRCGSAGSMSHGTHGGGPWYCARHFTGLVSERSDLPAGGFKAMKAVIGTINIDLEAVREREAIQAESTLG